jgi:ATP synthase protein I
MNEPNENGPAPDEFERTVEGKQNRKLRARREGVQSPWFGLGMFGLVGWSIVIPTLAGILIGSWIDGQWPSRVSWKLTLLFLGLAIGCGNAWFWIQKEMNE